MYTLVIKMPLGDLHHTFPTFEMARRYYDVFGGEYDRSIEDFEGRVVCATYQYKVHTAEDKNVKK